MLLKCDLPDFYRRTGETSADSTLLSLVSWGLAFEPENTKPTLAVPCMPFDSYLAVLLYPEVSPA